MANACDDAVLSCCSELITAAIASLKDRTGSSSPAIQAAIIKANPRLDFKKHLYNAALKHGEAAGLFVRHHQHKNSFKLGAAAKAATKKVAAKKKPAAKKVRRGVLRSRCVEI